MHIITRLIVGIDITHPLDIFADAETNLLNILAEKYEGKCFSNYFITKVNKIIRRSECMIQSGCDTFGSMNMIIEVDAIKYNQGDIITGCVIRNKDKSGIIIAVTPTCAVCLDAQDIFNVLKQDNIITVRVGMSKYPPGSDKININAYPFLPEKKKIIYFISNLPEPNIPDDLYKDMLNRINTEEKRITELKKTNNKGWDFFYNLFYPYKTKQNIGKDEKTLSVKDIVDNKLAIGYYTRDPKINMAEASIVFSPDKPNDGKLIDNVGTNVCKMALLKSYLDGMTVVREHVELYNEKLLKEHVPLWTMYTKQKI
jgi:DNA-directed RNA polymerase subunit E'/Rpb7